MFLISLLGLPGLGLPELLPDSLLLLLEGLTNLVLAQSMKSFNIST
jgi:hypothetical protein